DGRVGEWRLDANLAAMRTKLGQVTDTMALASITGSFVEGMLRATWRRDRTWHVDARYRARVWADHRTAQRAQIAGDWRYGALDVQLSAGLDVHHEVGAAPGLVSSKTLLYRASVGRKTAGSELAAGVAAVA